MDPIHPMVPGDSEERHFVTTLYVLDQDESLVALRELAPDEPAPASMEFTVPDGVTQLTPYESPMRELLAATLHTTTAP